MLKKASLLVLFLVPGIFILCRWVLWHLFVAPEINLYNRLASVYLTNFEEDNYRINRELMEIVRPLRKKSTKDAGSLLNDKVTWTRPATGPISFDSPPVLYIPDSVSETVRVAGNKWPVMPIPDKVSDSTQLFPQLAEFTYWNIEKNSPRETSLMAREDFYNLPEPDYKALKVWSKIYLAHSYKEGNIQQGIKDMLALTRLIYSTESFHSPLGAFSVLRAISYFAHFHNLDAVSKNFKKFYKSENLEAIRRSFVFQSNTFNLFSNSGLTKEIFTRPSYGRCAAVSHGLLNLRLMRQYGDSRINTRGDSLIKFAARIQKSGCRLSLSSKVSLIYNAEDIKKSISSKIQQPEAMAILKIPVIRSFVSTFMYRSGIREYIFAIENQYSENGRRLQ